MARLTGKPIFNTGPFVVDGVQRTLQWPNPEKRPIYVRKSLVWIGLGLNAKADLYGQLIRTSDGDVINPFCWDRYANPNGPQDHPVDFHDGDFMELGTNDSITLYYYAASADGEPCSAHVAAWLWYF
jgi:hypothetical protein